MNVMLLSERFNNVFSNVTQSKWRYCHKKSVGNFILHLSKIKGKSEKREVVELINHYLDDIENIKGEIDMNFSISLFDNYVNYLSNKFQYRVGFFVIFTAKAMIIVIPLLAIIFLILQISSFLLYTYLVLLSSYLIWLGVKICQKKVYGFGY
jgi:hypothetical protein